MSAAELQDAGEQVPDDVDVHTTAGKLADFARRQDEALHAGSEKAVEKQHAAGKMTARERVDALLDEGSFTEFDEFAPGTGPPTSGWRPSAPSATAWSPATAPSTAGRWRCSART